MLSRVLVVAGSDSGGGAGIQGDLKTIMALGGYATTAITAVTAQDTLGVHGVHPIPPGIVRRQMECVLSDIGADAIKTGMLGTTEIIAAVCDVLEAQTPLRPLVVDPVMVSTSGHRLLDADALALLTGRLLKLATVITPNLPEAEALLGVTINDVDAMARAAVALRERGAEAVLLKGGHLPGEHVIDLLATASGVEHFVAPRLPGRNTHGTGCTLASAVAIGLAQGMPLHDAVLRARNYVRAAIAAAPKLGAGHGPLQHAIGLGSLD